jgi:hypothetical protein
MSRSLSVLAFGSPLLALVMPATASAATLNVCSSCTYTTISDALDAAAEGDTIEVAAGTYSESIDLDFDVTLTGAGASVTEITGPSDVISITDVTATVTGFTVTPTSNRGFDVDGSTVVLDDVIVSGGASVSDGGGMRITSTSDVTITNAIFDNNVADVEDYGGHIYVTGSTLSLDGVEFLGGEALGGGALYANSATVTIANSTFEGNDGVGTADIDGFGAAIGGSTVDMTITNTTFDGNALDSADGQGRGGAIALYTSTLSLDTVGFTGNTITDSAGTSYGGAVYANGTDVTVVDSDFTANSVVAGVGGGLYVYNADLDLSSSTFSANTVSADGGAVQFWGFDASATIDDCEFDANIAGDDGGAFSVSDNGGTLTAVTVSNSVFSANTAADNGGGIVYYSGADLDISGSEFDGNLAVDYGGALHLDAGPSSVTVDASSFKRNEADAGGGAIRIEDATAVIAAIDITDSVFYGHPVPLLRARLHDARHPRDQRLGVRRQPRRGDRWGHRGLLQRAARRHQHRLRGQHHGGWWLSDSGWGSGRRRHQRSAHRARPVAQLVLYQRRGRR